MSLVAAVVRAISKPKHIVSDRVNWTLVKRGITVQTDTRPAETTELRLWLHDLYRQPIQFKLSLHRKTDVVELLGYNNDRTDAQHAQSA